MSFQILNPEGKPVSIKQLDVEAAEVWDKEVHSKDYACPPNNRYGNWFDVIGWAIHRPENYAEGWNDVKCTLWTIQAKHLYQYLMTQPEDLIDHMYNTRKFLRPYYDLIDYWESKGYKPITLKD